MESVKGPLRSGGWGCQGDSAMNQMPPGVAFHYCTLLNATTGGGGGKGKQGDLLKTQLGLGFAEEKTSQRRWYCQIIAVRL